MKGYIPYNIFADILGISRSTLASWESRRIVIPVVDTKGRKYFNPHTLTDFKPIAKMVNTTWDEELRTVPLSEYTSIELFAGAGGLAIGLEEAGFEHILLNEIDTDASQTLIKNRPNWNVLNEDIHEMDFTAYKGKVDLLSGGFPCQAFSYAGKQGGFEDARGTLFFEMARAVIEAQPKIMLAENVRGLTSHDGGKTLTVIKNTIKELGYTLVEPKVLKALMYKVPQKRERIFLIAFRNDLAEKAVEAFSWPQPYNRVMTLRDAFFEGALYPTDVPQSEGQTYPEKKKAVLDLVPMGGDWRDLPIEVQKQYMGKSFTQGGGKTGMARRLSLDEPSLTLTCSPAQKQTERCHPTETRPLTVREYARIQTFPDEWQFTGTLSSQYKQIGNAVPVNLASAVGRSLIRVLNHLTTS